VSNFKLSTSKWSHNQFVGTRPTLHMSPLPLLGEPYPCGDLSGGVMWIRQFSAFFTFDILNFGTEPWRQKAKVFLIFFSEENLLWQARYSGNSQLLNRAHNYATPSCDQLEKIYSYWSRKCCIQFFVQFFEKKLQKCTRAWFERRLTQEKKDVFSVK
jgi:hypothetical protein